MGLTPLLNKLRRLDLAREVKAAAAVGDIQIREQIRDKCVLLVDLWILKAACLEQEFIEAHKATHAHPDLFLPLGIVLLNSFGSFRKVECQGFLFSRSDALGALFKQNLVELFDIQRIQHHERIQIGLQIVDVFRVQITREQGCSVEGRESCLYLLVGIYKVQNEGLLIVWRTNAIETAICLYSIYALQLLKDIHCAEFALVEPCLILVSDD